MLQLLSTGYNLLSNYPTGNNPKGQAELILNFQQVGYCLNENGELVKKPIIETVRFITESEQLKELSVELMELANQLELTTQRLNPSCVSE